MSATFAHPTLHRWWPWIKRFVALAFFAVVTIFLIAEARRIDWPAVISSLRAVPTLHLAIAGMLAVASHALFSTFDLFGHRYVQHTLSIPAVMGVNFISYAFNLNFGALIGGVAFRYRLYSRLGLTLGEVTQIISLSMLTNWLGYVLLAGMALIWQPLALPQDWALHAWALRGIGILMLALAMAYVVGCGVSRRREWKLRGRTIELPSLRIALGQLLVSCVNWLLMAALIYVLLQQRIAYPAVLSALLAAAVAGVVTHVPAGLGVIEAVFIALLSQQLPREELLASVLIYRFIYYLVPLAIAVAAYVPLEMRARQLRDRNG